MQPRLRHRSHAARSERPAVPRVPLLLALAVSWAGAAALWACTALPLLRQGRDGQVAAGSTLAGAALLLSAALGARTQRSVSDRLARLRVWAREVTSRQAAAMAECRSAERPFEPAAVAPELPLGNDELGSTAEALCAAQRAVLGAVAQQWQAAESVRAVFLSLARRIPPLLHLQLAELDGLEREYEDPDLLHRLFAVDHLSTRLRRHAENLVILGGGRPPRQWPHGVALMDVVRSAVSETAEYTRVEVEKLPDGTVCGHAVADVVHLLAELLENGCTFSPPHTRVTVNGEEVSHGLVLEVEDRGLGMSDEQYRELNASLAAPAPFAGGPHGPDGRLGMLVVARLAGRHGVDVELRRSPYGGTRVIVLLPRGIAAGAGSRPRCLPSAPQHAGSPHTAPDSRAPRDVAPAGPGAAEGPGGEPGSEDPDEPDLWLPGAGPEHGRDRPLAHSGAAAGAGGRAEAARSTMAAIQRATRLARHTEPQDAEPGGADRPARRAEDRPQ